MIPLEIENWKKFWKKISKSLFSKEPALMHLKDHKKSPTLEDILSVDNWARSFVIEEIRKGAKYIKV